MAGPEALIVDPVLSVNNRNNPTHTAGTTFMGQFLDHDMTFDRKSPWVGRGPRPPPRTPARPPSTSTQSMAGGRPGPRSSTIPAIASSSRSRPVGYLKTCRATLPLTSRSSAIRVTTRTSCSVALHAAFLLFHNNAVDLVRSKNPSISDDAAFTKARRLTTYHYQWLIIREFLPLFVGQTMVDDILANGRRFYTPRDDEAFIPVEFQIVYRFGHSMVRPSYRANLAGDNGNAFFGMIFDPAGEGSPDPVDLRGGAGAPRRFIGRQTFFDFGDGQVKPNKRIDTKLSTPLFHLPLAAIPAGTPPTSLPQRNLLRHLTWSLPSGQEIARFMGAPVLSTAELADAAEIRKSFATSTPLWFYVLREAELKQDGLQLGAVGGRIVGEVFIGLLQADPESFINAKPDFKPTLPTKTGKAEDFRMIDFLTFAGVDPASRGQSGSLRSGD
jgi:Animal haem peroxidase